MLLSANQLFRRNAPLARMAADLGSRSDAVRCPEGSDLTLAGAAAAEVP
jgi:hypothetical protein